MKKFNLIKLASLLILSLCSLEKANAAAVIVVAPTATTTGSFTFTHDLTFTFTKPGTVLGIIFDEWVTATDAAAEAELFSPNLSFSVNHAAPATSQGFLSDNAATDYTPDFTAKDGYLYLYSGPTVNQSDTFTVKAGTYVMPAESNYNPLTTQTFTGNMHLLDGSFSKMSDTVNVAAVPEPTTYALLGMGAAALAFARRRKV